MKNKLIPLLIITYCIGLYGETDRVRHVDPEKQKNFFETKVTEYQSSGSLADDF